MASPNPFDEDRPLSAKQSTIWFPIIGVVVTLLVVMIIGDSVAFGVGTGDRVMRAMLRLLVLGVGGGFILRWFQLRAQEQRKSRRDL